MSEMLDRTVAQRRPDDFRRTGKTPSPRSSWTPCRMNGVGMQRLRSPEVLERLATQAGEEDRQGLTEELDPEAVRALDELMAECEVPLRDSIDTDAARRQLPPLPEPDGRN